MTQNKTYFVMTRSKISEAIFGFVKKASSVCILYKSGH